MNSLLSTPKGSSSESTRVELTAADIAGLMELSRGECTVADDTSASTINRRVLRKLMDFDLAFISSPPIAIPRARITERGRNVLQAVAGR